MSAKIRKGGLRTHKLDTNWKLYVIIYCNFLVANITHYYYFKTCVLCNLKLVGARYQWNQVGQKQPHLLIIFRTFNEVRTSQTPSKVPLAFDKCPQSPYFRNFGDQIPWNGQKWMIISSGMRIWFNLRESNFYSLDFC